MPARSIFHLERLAPVEGLRVCVPAALHVFGMYSLSPAFSQRRFERQAGEVEPRLIDVGALLVDAGHPDRDGSGIRHETKPLSALARGRHFSREPLFERGDRLLVLGKDVFEGGARLFDATATRSRLEL